VTMTSNDHLAAGDSAGVDVPALEVLGDVIELTFVESRTERVDLHTLAPAVALREHCSAWFCLTAILYSGGTVIKR
jgi:hypothetical protein